MQKLPPHIHVLLALEAPLALVIRRGPGKQSCTMLWDRRDDSFQLGQWMKSDIDVHQSDLSADGKYFIYYAMNGKSYADRKSTWTAISRAPYLKALALWTKDYYGHGGGLWTGNRTYLFNDGYDGWPHTPMHDTDEVEREMGFKRPADYDAFTRAYCTRLKRAGWICTEVIEQDAEVIAGRGGKFPLEVFERPIGHGWVLQKVVDPLQSQPIKNEKFRRQEKHQLLHRQTCTTIAHDDWDWVDLDGERLVYAAAGVLYAARVTKHGVGEVTTLFDFNEMRFSRVLAPY